MKTIKQVSLNEIPSYIKHSWTYSNLIEHNVKQINVNEIHLFKLIEVNKMTFDDFIELLKTIYFWKIPFEQCPIELFIYISMNLKIVKYYIDKYSNELTKFLLQLKFNDLFLESTISYISSVDLLNYAIENNLKNINVFFSNLCVFGNITIIKYMFNKIDIHYDDDLALRYAAENGQLDVVKFLLERGADIHADNDYALRYAAKKGHLDVVKFLLENGLDIHAKNDEALRIAAKNGHLVVVKLLLEHGADIHAFYDQALCYAAQNGQLDIVKLLLEHEADIHAQDDYALCWSAENGKFDIVKFVLEHEADIHANDDFALRRSAENGYFDVVKLLLEHGPDIHAKDDFALRRSAENGYFDVVKLLLEHGPDIHAKDDFALRRSAENGYFDVVKILLSHSLETNNKFSKYSLLTILKSVKNNLLKSVIENYIDENF